jgi:predicted membrane-bound spermidine synthase
MAVGFQDPRVTVFNGDGCEYAKGRKGEFDVIIVDSSDPIGESIHSPIDCSTFDRTRRDLVHRKLLHIHEAGS